MSAHSGWRASFLERSPCTTKSGSSRRSRTTPLFEALEHELDEGRKYYEKNVDAAVRDQTDYFDRAVVDILVKGHGSVESKIW